MLMDEALSQLRADGASIIESVKAVHDVQGCDLAQAKRVVHFSNAWSDVERQQHEHFHDELIKGIEDEANS